MGVFHIFWVELFLLCIYVVCIDGCRDYQRPTSLHAFCCATQCSPTVFQFDKFHFTLTNKDRVKNSVERNDKSRKYVKTDNENLRQAEMFK